MSAHGTQRTVNGLQDKVAEDGAPEVKGAKGSLRIWQCKGRAEQIGPKAMPRKPYDDLTFCHGRDRPKGLGGAANLGHQELSDPVKPVRQLVVARAEKTAAVPMSVKVAHAHKRSAAH